MAPFVSVIIPAYNSGRFVAEAVQSALDQDYAAKEVIVVNDGSTDDTLRVLSKFGNAIRLIDQKNGGPPVARNAGLRAAKGNYIAFLDSDDVWLPGKVAAQVAYLERDTEIGAVYTDWQEWRPEPDGSFRIPKLAGTTSHDLATDEAHSGWLYNRLLFDCELLTTTVMLRASLIGTIGEFDTGLFMGEDYDYWIRTSRVAKIHKLRSVGALYRVLPDSVSHRPWEKNFEYEVISKAISRWGLVGPDGTVTDKGAIGHRLEELVYRHGYEHYHNGDPQLAFAAFREVLRRHPGNAKAWVYAALAAIKLGSRSIGVAKSAS
jgi:glycosyltransferase involved in cell wall biosynthesis